MEAETRATGGVWGWRARVLRSRFFRCAGLREHVLQQRCAAYEACLRRAGVNRTGSASRAGHCQRSPREPDVHACLPSPPSLCCQLSHHTVDSGLNVARGPVNACATHVQRMLPVAAVAAAACRVTPQASGPWAPPSLGRPAPRSRELFCSRTLQGRQGGAGAGRFDTTALPLSPPPARCTCAHRPCAPVLLNRLLSFWASAVQCAHTLVHSSSDA